MTNLLDQLKIKDVTLKNRIGVAPIAQHIYEYGKANDWHMVNFASRAIGGFGLILTEAAIEPEGRISNKDAGIWSDEHIEKLSKINKFISDTKAVPGIQLNHYGRKISIEQQPVGFKKSGLYSKASSEPVFYSANDITQDQIKKIINSYRNSALRAYDAGYKWLEINASHGSLINSFLSPLNNSRNDMYAGSFENRIRFLREVINAVQSGWNEKYPLSVKISVGDWHDNVCSIEESLELIKILKSEYNIDLINCSSNNVFDYLNFTQPDNDFADLSFSEEIKNKSGLVVAVSGIVTKPEQADYIIANHKADLVFLARESVQEAYWPIKAAKQLNYDWVSHQRLQNEKI